MDCYGCGRFLYLKVFKNQKPFIKSNYFEVLGKGCRNQTKQSKAKPPDLSSKENDGRDVLKLGSELHWINNPIISNNLKLPFPAGTSQIAIQHLERIRSNLVFCCLTLFLFTCLQVAMTVGVIGHKHPLQNDSKTSL